MQRLLEFTALLSYTKIAVSLQVVSPEASSSSPKKGQPYSRSVAHATFIEATAAQLNSTTDTVTDLEDSFCDGLSLSLTEDAMVTTHLNPENSGEDALLAMDEAGHTFSMNRRKVKALILQDVAREVTTLQAAIKLTRSRYLQPVFGRGSGHTSAVPITASGAAIVQMDQDPTAGDVADEFKRNMSNLRSRLKAACSKVGRLEKALAASETQPRKLETPNWELLKAISSKPLPPTVPLAEESTFDIVVNAFKRDMELEYALRNYVDCKNSSNRLPIAKIHVVWNDWNRTIPASLAKLNVSFFVPPSKNTNISNRFWPLDFASNAVFHVDDDVPHFCEILSDLFELWKSDVDGIVGTSPRLLDLGAGGLDGFAVPLVHGQYNVVWVTKGAMVHKRFFDEYWKPLWAPIRGVIDSYNCAEDMLFSAIHKTIVGKGHVYAVAASVNHGSPVLWEGWSLYTNLNKVESYVGLNVRTWPVRGFAGEAIGKFLREHFPEKHKSGIYFDVTKRFWRSTVHPSLSCRQLPLPCYNRDWPECWEECGDDPVRGTNVCFRGDGACFAGMGLSLGMDVGENMMIVCVAGNCSAMF